MKKIVTVRIEVDLESETSNTWENKNEYFENEVDEVMETLTSISRRRASKYSSEEGKTEGGSKFKVVVKKEK